MFNIKDHLISLKGKDYLEVKWRLVWFRDTHPQGQILTDLVTVSDVAVIMKATILNGEGQVLSTGYGSAPLANKAVWSGREIEKAETAAIGRALAHAGFGTQFTDEEEGDHLADAPVERKPAPAPSSNGNGSPFKSSSNSTAPPEVDNHTEYSLIQEVEIFTAKNGKKMIKAANATAFTTQKFKDIGIDVSTWGENGPKALLDPVIVGTQVNGNFNNIVEVMTQAEYEAMNGVLPDGGGIVEEPPF